LAGLSPAHLFLILIIALVVIGPDMLPDAEAAVGKSVREFQEASGGVQESIAETPSQPPPSAPDQSSTMPSYLDQWGYAAPIYPVPVAPPAEWIDPEGDDWFATIYRELTQEPNSPVPSSEHSPELEHWFG
jgi:Sec-independent protein translocase protein TatA